jgi:C1A family cysteine protease
MKLFLLFAFALNNLCQSREPDYFHRTEFVKFQERFSKYYSNVQEMETRFSIFKTNLIQIISHNADRSQNFTMGVNQFTDLTPQEFKSQYVRGENTMVNLFGCKSFSSMAYDVPESFDWRTKGVVNPVKDQGQCGSCWAFAATANAESVWAIDSGELLDLSEEFLVDCASGIGYRNQGCNGGNPDSAFRYMINNGQCSEESYPYKAGVTKTASTCQKCSKTQVHFSSCSDVVSKDQVSLKAAVSKQPVVIAIEADTRYFQSYSGGILDSVTCGTDIDHAVEIVGYGSENGIDYWIVRNSWSSSWGENGYIRLKRSSSVNDIGVCGLATSPSFLSV